jgi:RNA polymerase sigma-70 factor, ECF subfamily
MEGVELIELIRRAQRQDPAAFDALVEAYGARLYGYFYRLTGCREDAEDLLQEVFIRVVRMIDRYKDEGRFDGWIFRIATNLVRDRVRRSRSSRSAGIDVRGRAVPEPDALAGYADPTMGEPGDGLQQAEQIDRLQQALERLPAAEREVILLRHFSQLSFRDIAETMGTPLGTALARAHRGLARLRELMGDEAKRRAANL